jgi:GGDEF domain-containing protein
MQDIIKRLSYDKMFGILTRPALEMEIEKLSDFDCCLIDFNNLKKLNQLLGYSRVNKIIFDVFDLFKKDNCSIIGRWFSGDEVLIIDDNIKDKIAVLEDICHNSGMTFKKIYYKNIKTLLELEGKIVHPQYY